MFRSRDLHCVLVAAWTNFQPSRDNSQVTVVCKPRLHVLCKLGKTLMKIHCPGLPVGILRETEEELYKSAGRWLMLLVNSE